MTDADGASLSAGQLAMLSTDGSWVTCTLDEDARRYVCACEAPSAFRACGFAGHYPASGTLPEADLDSGVITVVLEDFVVVDVEFLGVGGDTEPWFQGSDAPLVVVARTPIGGWLPTRPRPGEPQLEGVFTRNSRLGGSLLITAPPPLFAGLVLGQRVLEWKTLSGTSPVQFALPADGTALLGDVTFCVLDGAGRPLPSSTFWIAADGLRERPPALPVDGGGCGHLPGVPPGDWALGVVSSGFGETRLRFTIDSGQSLDLGSLRLQPGGYVKGTLTGDLAAEVSYRDILVWDGRTWALLGLTGPYQGGMGKRSEFAIGQLPPGRVQVSLLAPGVALNPTPLDIVGREQELILDVRPGAELVLKALRDGCRPGPAPTGMRLLDSTGQLVWAGLFEDARLWVLAGRYDVRTPLVDGTEQSTSVAVPAGGMEVVVAR
ncbi:MAG: hypothetical protein HOP15_02730 [Planctomycetes bacterium]|nr:hypothetical protein [Planctomycetota bacterium]